MNNQPTIELGFVEVEAVNGFVDVKKFMRRVKKDGVLFEVRERQSFVSAGQRRRQKKQAGIYETKRREIKRLEMEPEER